MESGLIIKKRQNVLRNLVFLLFLLIYFMILLSFLSETQATTTGNSNIPSGAITVNDIFATPNGNGLKIRNIQKIEEIMVKFTLNSLFLDKILLHLFGVKRIFV